MYYIPFYTYGLISYQYLCFGIAKDHVFNILLIASSYWFHWRCKDLYMYLCREKVVYYFVDFRFLKQTTNNLKTTYFFLFRIYIVSVIWIIKFINFMFHLTPDSTLFHFLFIKQTTRYGFCSLFKQDINL